MKTLRIIFFASLALFCFILSPKLSAQKLKTGVFSLTVGWNENQNINQIFQNGTTFPVDNTTTFSVDFSHYKLFGTGFLSAGFGGGATLRAFNIKNIQSENIDIEINNDWTSRLEAHIGPIVKVQLIPRLIDVLGTAEITVGYAGKDNGNLKFNWGARLSTDVVIARIISVGFNYRPFKSQVFSNNWSTNHETIMHLNVNPTYEIKVGFTILY